MDDDERESRRVKTQERKDFAHLLSQYMHRLEVCWEERKRKALTPTTGGDTPEP